MRFAVNMKMKITNEYRFFGVKKKKKKKVEREIKNRNQILKKRRCMYQLYDNIMFFYWQTVNLDRHVQNKVRRKLRRFPGRNAEMKDSGSRRTRNVDKIP